MISKREKIFMAVVAIFILMAIGPGLALVNRVEFIGSFPLLYCWAVFWFVILSVTMVVGYHVVWREEDVDELGEGAGEDDKIDQNQS